MTKQRVSIAVLAAAGLLAAAPAGAAAQSIEELSAQVKALQARVAELESKETVSRADVDEAMRRVFADADKRSQVFDSSQFRAGWDPKLEKFIVGSADGNFTWSPVLIWQFRGIGVVRDDPVGNPDHNQVGFENRRTRFGMEGTLATKDLSYRFLWESGRDSGTVSLLDAFARYKLSSDWSIKAGQFKDPWTQEENASDAKQMAVERSAMNAIIGGALTDRIQGVGISFDNAKPLRAQLVLHDGGNSKNTTFQDGPPTALPLLAASEDYGVAGRVEYFAMGAPKAYEDYSAMGNKDELLVFGAGGDYTGGSGNSALFHAADVQYENTTGLGLFAEYMGLARDISAGTTGASGVNAGNYYDYGFLVQASQMLGRRWEVFGKYDWIHLDAAAFSSARATRQSEVQEISVGVNYYIFKHNAKVTVDLNYLPDGSPEVPGLGYMATEDDELVLRTQLQLAL